MFRAETPLEAPAFVSYVSGLLKAKYGENTVYRGGLRVTTTLNWTLQQAAQRAVTDQVNRERWRNLTQGALVSMDPRTGAVLVMVGSADPNGNGGQFNMTVIPRNPGSSMKIYNYTAAIESRKYTMVTPVTDSPIRMRLPGSTETWEPKNYDQRYHGTCQLQQCMGNSLNVPAVKIELGIGVPAVVVEARKMGAPPFDEHGRQDGPADGFGPSLTLGGYGETVLQMATGAAALASPGSRQDPFAISRITTADGTEIFKQDDPAKTAKPGLDPKVAWIMQTIMSDDDNRAMIFGRGSPLTLPGRHVGAKTGTTDNFTDGWTVGYTPSIATAVWMGNPNFSAMVQGSDGVFVAAPAWHNFMQFALDYMKKGDEWFAEPSGLGHAVVAGKIAYFLPGTSPTTAAPPLPAWVVTGGTPPPRPAPRR
jgi:membrane peptidoglycan carboxypeptidase